MTDEVMQRVSLSTAVEVSRLDGLRALRAKLAEEIESQPPEFGASQTAALARQLRDTLREIAELEKLSPRKSVVDDLAAAREARRSATKSVAPAAGDRQQ